MPFEFFVWLDHRNFPKSQDLPEIFWEDGYNGNKHVYLISTNRIRMKVKIVKAHNRPFKLKGNKWTEFSIDNIGHRVRLLHFIQEGDDTYYVTGYDGHGEDFGGYEGIEGRYKRFHSRVWASSFWAQKLSGDFLTGLGQTGNIAINVEGHRFIVPVSRVQVNGVNVGNDYELLQHSWDEIQTTLHLQPGMHLVFTKYVNTEFWMMAFNTDGSQHTEMHFFGATRLNMNQPPIPPEDRDEDRMYHLCRWPRHTEHFGEFGDVFYKSFSYIVVMQRLTIPADFLAYHPMHTYTHALMRNQNVEYRMTVKMEFHKEDPERTNHINVFGAWSDFAEECQFRYDKMLRFKYMYLITDLVGEEDEHIPVFHVC